jgi:hypothetical protein
MAIDRMKAILLISILLAAFSVQAQDQLNPVEPELDIKVRPPIQNVVQIDGEFRVVGGFCGLTEQQKDVLWQKILVTLTEEYPEHSKYCERKLTSTTKSFVVINGICRAYINCEKTVDGVEILHGYFIVEVDEKTMEVRRFIDVAW